MHNDDKTKSATDADENDATRVGGNATQPPDNPGGDMQDEPSDRLRKARIDAGFETATEAAERFGWTVSTYLSHENGSRGITAKAADRYGRAFKVDREMLLYGKVGKNTEPLEKVPDLSYKKIPVIGNVAAGQWLEVDMFVDAELSSEWVPILPDARLPDDTTFGLRVRGTSLNKIAKDGALLICTEAKWSGIGIEPGDLVVVQQIRHQEGLREVTAKRVEKVRGGFDLIPESTDPRYQERIHLPYPTPDASSERSVEIVAKVRYIVQTP